MGNCGRVLLGGRAPAVSRTERRRASDDAACVLGFFPVVVAEKNTGVLELLALWSLLGSICAVIILFRLSRETRATPPASRAVPTTAESAG